MPFRIGLSGLNASSADLRVIGNNVANVNTTGFKKSRAEFSDIYAVSNLGVASNAIGSGVRISAVSQQFTQGNIGFTDNNLDLGISGQGFFRLSDGGSIVYSRAGAFGVDRQGFVNNSSGQRLTAFLADSAGNITGTVGDLQLDSSDLPPTQTASVAAALNVDATQAAPAAAFNVNDPTTYNHSTSLTIYDSLGTSHLSTMYYRKTAANTWETYLYVDGNQLTSGGVANVPLTFNSSGALTAPVGGTITYDAYSPGGGAANLNLTYDYSNTTQFGSKFSIFSLSQDGFPTGRLSGVDIDGTGIVLARYTNGQSRVLAQIALANFSNSQGLRQLGDTNWAESFESGPPLVAAPDSSGLGLVQSGALEGSNVDLTEQLVNMITAQRNFQANAQVISTADTITQTMINIR